MPHVMRKPIIGTPRWTVHTIFGMGGEQALYPAYHMGQLPLSKVARSTDTSLANTQIICSLTQERPVQLVVLCGHNLTTSAKLRTTVYAQDGTTILYQSEWENVWPRVYDDQSLPWEADNWWTLTFTEEEITGKIWHRPVWLPTLIRTDKIIVEIDDQSNPAGYVEIGFCEIAEGWELPRSMSYGYQMGFDNDGARIFEGVIEHLPETDAAKAHDFLRSTLKKHPFFFMPRPDVLEQSIRESFLVALEEISKPQRTAYNLYSMRLRLKEITKGTRL